MLLSSQSSEIPPPRYKMTQMNLPHNTSTSNICRRDSVTILSPRMKSSQTRIKQYPSINRLLPIVPESFSVVTSSQSDVGVTFPKAPTVLGPIEVVWFSGPLSQTSWSESRGEPETERLWKRGCH